MEARGAAAEKPARLLAQRDSKMPADTEVQEAHLLPKQGGQSSSKKGVGSGMVRVGKVGKPPQGLIPSSHCPASKLTAIFFLSQKS